jgi:hypothetical protein
MTEPVAFPIYDRLEQRILTLCDWRTFAPPAHRDHWQDGRSAKELARRWLGGRLPPEVAGLLASRPAFRGFAPEAAWAEHKTRLDARRGNSRTHDLLVVGRCGGAAALLDVEGKADEPFGDTIAVALAKAVARRAPGAIDRIHELCRAVLAATPAQAPQVPYQLVYGTAAALLAAARRRAPVVAWVVHEFRTPALDARKLAANARALNAFAADLAGVPDLEVPPGALVGPLRVRGDGLPRSIDLYLGKAVHHLA